MKCCAAIIVAAGSSRRAGFDKLLAPLHGVKVLERSIRAFASCREITEIVVVCPEERFHAINGADLETEIPVTRVDGGAERHESVQNGLAALLYTPEFVAVHDGARPLITVEQISRCIQTAREYGAAASAHPVTDTLKRADKNALRFRNRWNGTACGAWKPRRSSNTLFCWTLMWKSRNGISR